MGTKNDNATRLRRSSKIAKRMWIGFGIFMGIIMLLIIFIYNGWIGYTPHIDQLKNPTDKFASTIYAAGGEEMGRFYRSKANRVYVDFDQMSPHLRNALVATEDVRFDDHSGIDLRALGRSIIKRVIMGNQSAGGGSTITQQLAKQLYSPESSGLFERALQKPIEWVIAVKLERYYTKDEIVKMYFNQFDFLNNAVGIKTASFVYFGKEPNTLSIEEAATLVGMCKNPAYYNPRRFPDRTRERRNIVFDQMVKAGYLSQAECDSLKQLPLILNYHKVDHNDGLAPYFREELRRVMSAKKPERKDYNQWSQQQFIDDSIAWETNPLFGWCAKNKKPDGSNYDIYTDGLKIYTTIDARMQEYAENAVREQMKNKKRNPQSMYSCPANLKEKIIRSAIHRTSRYQALKAEGKSEAEIMQNFNTPTDLHMFSYEGDYVKRITPLDSMLEAKSYMRCATMSMDPVTGHVKTYVGGPDFRFFKYDMVATGRRQIGSTVKPYVYSYAIENGRDKEGNLISPGTIRPGGSPAVKWYNTVWNPKGVGGAMTLKSALTASVNSISAGFMKGTAPNHIEEDGNFVFPPSELARWMHTFGITAHLEETPALSLGACEVSIQEMVSAYSAFANGGLRALPIYVTRICDNHGNVVAEFAPQHKEVFSERTHYNMVDMMMNVVNAGTGTVVKHYVGGAQTCGKTGTTNENSDAWFMGFTPELVTGVWVGGEERYIRNTGIGGTEAAPVYGRFMQQVYADSSLPYSTEAKFNFPPGYKVTISGGGGGGGGAAAGGGAAEAVAIEGAFD